MTFGDKLKKLRKEKGLTIDQAAEQIGISRRAYITYERNSTRPRKRETYSRIADLYGCDVNYLLMEDTGKAMGATAALATLAGIMTTTAVSPVGMGVVLAALAEVGIINALSGKGKNKKIDEPLTYNNDILLQYEKKQKRFKAIASGIICKAIMSKGYSFVPGELKDLDDVGVRPDEYLVFSEELISSWWFIYWAKDKKLDDSVIISATDRASVLFSRMVTIASDKKRKVSIVVDDMELYDAVLKLANHNSYRGYATVILIDTEGIELKKEEIVATYEEDENIDLLSLIDDEA
ncbi:MAG: helix-turn-helix transcriptional regulator [bacterium]|nr:helix-turn-helix transcriptional regulator [bacterium]